MGCVKTKYRFLTHRFLTACRVQDIRHVILNRPLTVAEEGLRGRMWLVLLGVTAKELEDSVTDDDLFGLGEVRD